MSPSDWEDLQAALWRLVLAQEASLTATAEEFGARIVAALRASGYVLDPAAGQAVEDYLSALESSLRDAIGTALTPIAAALVPVALRSAWIAERMAEAYSLRWPDGLRLSDRVWSWGEATRRAVSDSLARGVRLGRGANELIYDLQRQIEATTGPRFAIATQDVEDWASNLARVGRATLQGRASYASWLDAVERTRRHLATLREGGTARQAQATLDAIRAAVSAGHAGAIDEALQWWTYDRQLYDLRRIARTEMATAHHRATLAATADDPDIIGYRWRLSASHPEPDICDWYANIELGLGKGVWPRDQAPRQKAHPHCMCALIPATRPRAERGNASFQDFLATANPRQVAALVPAWAAGAISRGTALTDLLRPDGMGLITQKDALARGLISAPPV